jgi:hypothetical protein
MTNGLWTALIVFLIIIIITPPFLAAEPIQRSHVHEPAAPNDSRDILVVVVLDDHQQKDLSDASNHT